MARLSLTILYTVFFIISLSRCDGKTGFGGDRTASISLLPTSRVFTLSQEDPKRLQMVIIADPTGSMVEVQNALLEYMPSFTQQLLNTDFVFEIFCSTTSYTGTSFGEIVSIKSDTITAPRQLQDALTTCINTVIDQWTIGDERGLEAAKLTWSKIIENNRLDPNAIKLTMIVTNEDDCSRDLGLYPSDANVFNRCIDQNVLRGSPVPQIRGMRFPITDEGYASLDGLYPESIRHLSDRPIVLFPISRYANFFNNDLTIVTRTNPNSGDDLLRQRGHIFAPVVMPPPAAVGREAAYQCVQAKTNTTNNVMSFGMRYFQVAEATGNQTYSLCEPLNNVLDQISTNVQNEVNTRRFILNRRPRDPQDLRIEVTRQILDVDRAQSIIDRMNNENSRTLEANQWSLVSENTRRVNQTITKTQRWVRTLSHGQGFSYNPSTNELVFNNELYSPYNDILKVLSYIPAQLDANVDYEGRVNND